MTMPWMHVVHGVSLHEWWKAHEGWRRVPNDICVLLDAGLAEERYAGNCDTPYFIGVRIYECSQEKEISAASVRLRPTKEQKAAAEALLAKALARKRLSPEFKEFLAKQTPRTFITWTR